MPLSALLCVSVLRKNMPSTTATELTLYEQKQVLARDFQLRQNLVCTGYALSESSSWDEILCSSLITEVLIVYLETPQNSKMDIQWRKNNNSTLIE